MKFAYADPPYLGYGSFYVELHPNALDWDDPATHRKLIGRLVDEYPDGWALSMTSGNLFDILPMVPRAARIGSWVKPFASFKKNVSPAYCWEPVIFMGGLLRRSIVLFIAKRIATPAQVEMLKASWREAR